ncbi:glycoside hydrolase family 95 protein [Pseudoduganella sp. FT55W]|uniref:Glycoside hydrolase family 95 protein n=1 Tax=Duganella rivi TaxID=2666083 RepID=A0A7X4GPB6_9BURK|nr:glycoside hydrolase family 95 protein [Duganella rivi]MYM66695.1 glycoside hydrolase family 95 protein [Duganella rivi]
MNTLGLPARRRLLVSAGLATVFPGLAGAALSTADHAQADGALTLWYGQAAGPWVEALPVGNGRVGAMVFGRVRQERLQLNESSLFAGGPYHPLNPAAAAALPRVRALIAAGRYREATELTASDVIAKPSSQMPYGAAGDLLLDFHGLDEASGYQRSLDLDTAIASTQFTSNGARYRREVLASAPDGVVVMQLSADGGMLDFDLGYRHPREVRYGDRRAAGVAWDEVESLDAERRPSALAISADGPGALLIQGRNIASAGVPSALRYALRVCAAGDGQIAVEGERLRVRGATSVTIIIAAATSHISSTDVSGDPLALVRAASKAAIAQPYAALRARHVAAHRALFGRFSLKFDSANLASAPTDARIANAEQAADPELAAMAALYVQYARYLLLSCSRPGGQPANLQGMWNEGVNPPWGSKYTININTEMNYWPAQAANLAECVEPVLNMVEELARSGAVTARAMYGARGWVAHHNTDLWRASAPIDGPNWGMWPCGGAWLCQILWDHWDYGRDPAWLRRIYPLLKGASLFFIDTLVADPQGRGLLTSPSISPENEHHAGFALCAGPAMDRQIVRDLLAWTLAAHRELRDPDTALARTLARTRARLAPDRIGAQGQLQEWLEDWDAGAPEQQHRHVSHLYAVYPSEQINVRDTPALIAAAKVTLNTRGDRSTGWATAWRLALWARMGEGERALAILRGLLGPERTYPNMFDAHPPFQIDGNFGGAAGVLEMLVQSWGGEVYLLPALPRAWPNGAVRGLRLRGALEIDLDWQAGRPQRVQLRGPARARVRLRHAGRRLTLVLDADGKTHSNFNNHYTREAATHQHQ